MPLFGFGGRLESSGARVLAALTVYLVLVFMPTALADLPPPTIVTFNGQEVHLPGTVTVGQLFSQEGVEIKVGRLFDIQGAVIKADAFPPQIYVNGVPATESTRLGEADRVDLVGGRDDTEPSTVQTFANAGGNPQFKLGAGTITVRRGLVSGAVVPVSTIGEGPPTVALTFDDGPDPRWTPQILDVLKQEGIKATFFVIGRSAERYQRLVRREVADGMVVGDHTWDHPHLAGRDPAYVRGQIARTRDVLRGLHTDVTLFRPPYGSYNATTVSIASELGMRTIIWTVDPTDYRKPPPSVIMHRILSRVGPGSIILMHDGGGDRSRTVAALRMLIPELRKLGYGFGVLR
jgi:peptidoglycan/xylan/chitin deacetylase (PgdA/CDA1 family)